MLPGRARPRRCAARPWDEPALWDCRQSSKRRVIASCRLPCHIKGGRPLRAPGRADPAPGAPPCLPAWVIIGTLVSLLRKRLLATLVALLSCAWAGSAMVVMQAGAEGVTELSRTLPPSTWVALTPLPNQGRSAVFALGVNPTNN